MSFRQWGKIGTCQRLHSLVIDIVGQGQTSTPSPTVIGHGCRKFLSLSMACGHYRHIHHLGPCKINTKSPRLTIPESLFEQRRSSFMSSITFKPCKTRQIPGCKSLLEADFPYLIKTSTFFSHTTETKKEFTERRLMGFSRDQMFDVVSDINNYSKFLPWCESSVVTHRGLSHVEADLVIGMKPVTESYSSRVFLRKPTLIIAESNNGAHFNQMLTKWQFSPGLKTAPSSCVVDFYVSLEFRSVLHANIANVFFNEVVKAMAGAFYEEAKKRYGKESVPSRKIEIVKSDTDKTQF